MRHRLGVIPGFNYLPDASLQLLSLHGSFFSGNRAIFDEVVLFPTFIARPLFSSGLWAFLQNVSELSTVITPYLSSASSCIHSVSSATKDDTRAGSAVVAGASECQ